MMDYQLVSGKAGGDKIAKDYNVRGIPSTRLISPDKKVEVGGNHPNVSQINSKLQAAGLKEEDCDNVNINDRPINALKKITHMTVNSLTSKKISLSVLNSNKYKVTLYSANGQLTKVISNKFLSKGSHSLSWDGSALAKGVYFIQVSTTQQKLNTKILLTK